jgi:hypothetical protein
MTVEGGTKHPLRKESNRRWTEGNDLSLIEDDEDDVTGKVFKPVGKRDYHKTKQPLPADVRQWLETLPLKRVASELRIDRNSLRRGRDGQPVARSTQNKLSLLFRMMKRGVSLTEALKAMKLKQVVQMA